MKTHFFSLLILLLISSTASAQVANDACAGAQNLGTLPNPAACPSGAGTPQVYNLSNVGSVTENPYSTIIGCQSGFDMATPATDVWYSFVASGPELDVTVTGGLINPSIGLYEGTCAGLVPRGCNTGNSTALFTPLTAGTTYYLQISGQDPTDQGNFTLTLNNWTNCAQCITNGSLTVTPPPTNGTYQGGTTVTFCLQIDGYVQQTTNWLSAVVPSFGAGWDMTTLTPGPTPASIGGVGTWIWTNNVTSTATGLFSPNWGWYFDLDNDGNPGNNFGDSQYNSHPTGGDGLTAGPWQPFCWSITAANCPPGQTGDDLSMSINTLADGEIGSWQSLGCVSDPEFTFAATLVCCIPPIMSSVDPLCNGGTDGSATADAQGTGPFDYVWDDGVVTIQTTNGAAGPDVVTGLGAGTYNVTITDTWDGCVTTGTVTINEPPAITFTVTPVDANCGANDGSVNVAPAGGTPPYTYVWYSDPGLTTPIGQTGATATNLGAGTYYVEITDNNGCIVVANGTVANSSGPVINSVTFTDPLCNGSCDGTITVNITGGTAPINYDIGGPMQAGNVFTNVCAGTYTVTVTDNNGCTATAPVTLTDPPVLSMTHFANDLNCFEDSVGFGLVSITASGGTPAYQYSIDGGTTFSGSGMFANIGANTYNIVVQDANGCQVTGTETINQPPPLTMSFSAFDATCNGLCDGNAIVIPNGGTPGYVYNWSNGTPNTNAQSVNMCQGNYSLQLVDNNGCSIDTNFVINEPTAVTVNVTPVDATCGASDGTATAAPSGGTPGYTYVWFSDPALTIPIGQTGVTATNLAPGTYYVEVTDANGCKVSGSGVVNTTIGGTFDSAIPVAETCPGSCDGQITINATNAILYSIDGGVTFQASNVFTGLCAGAYNIVIEDPNGCQDNGSVNVGSPPPIVIASSPDTTICINGSATISANGAPAGSTYTWDNGLGTGQSHTVSPAVTTVYNVFATDPNGCISNSVPVVVSLNPPLSVVALSNMDICLGSSATISAIAQGGDGGPYTYVWDDGAGWTANGSLQTVSPTVTTTYTVTADDGCETPVATDQITITVNQPPVVDFVVDNTSGCVPLTVTFTNTTPPGSIGGTCIWDFGDGNGSTDCATTTHTYTSPGCYDVTLTVVSQEGCTGTTTYTSMVCVSPFPVALFAFGPQPTTVLNTEISFTNLSSGSNIVSYDWQFDELGTSTDMHPTFDFPNAVPGEYQVCLTVTNSDGCDSTYCQIVVIDGELLIYVPNTITPDGDGFNEEFFATGVGMEGLTNFKLMVFNRWGELIWEGHDPSETWNATYKGQKVKQEVYVWKLTAKNSYDNNKPVEYVGHVTVLY